MKENIQHSPQLSNSGLGINRQGSSVQISGQYDNKLLPILKTEFHSSTEILLFILDVMEEATKAKVK